MKINSIYIIIITIICSGCSKFLDTPPDLRTELDSPTKIAELLTSAYPRGNYIPFTESASDNAGDKGLTLQSANLLNMNPWMFKDVETSDPDSPTFYWYSAYKAISASNHALEAIEKLKLSKEWNSLRGEALLTRAYAHHMLIILFSKDYEPSTASTDIGIPYVTQPERKVLEKYNRGTVKSVYDQIEKDLVEGLPLLDDNRYKVKKYHFTKTAAHAFATRFYLFKHDYKKAIEHANLSLGSNIENQIRPVNTREFAAMEYLTMEQWFSSVDNPTNLLLSETATSWGRDFVLNRFGLSRNIMAELIFEKNITTGAFGYPIFGGTDYALHIPKFREHFVRTGLNAQYGMPYNMIPLFTVDELLLNRAEAYSRMKMFDHSIKDINTFISKKVYYSSDMPQYVPQVHNVNPRRINAFYGTLNLEENIIKTILDFKRREFLFEGLRWFDIIRHKIVVIHKSHDEKETYVLGINSPMRIFQLPAEVILSGIEQNPR